MNEPSFVLGRPICLSEQQNDVAVCSQPRHNAESEHVTAQERFDVLAIQPYDQVLHVIVVQPDSFYGHD